MVEMALRIVAGLVLVPAGAWAVWFEANRAVHGVRALRRMNRRWRDVR